MGMSFRRRKNLGNGLRLNLSTRGASISQEFQLGSGKITLNSKTGVTLNFGNGLVYRPPKNKK